MSSALNRLSLAFVMGALALTAARVDARADDGAAPSAPANGANGANGASSSSRATPSEDDAPPLTRPIELHHNLTLEVPLTAALLATVVGWRLVRDDLEPSECRWCDGNSPSDVNAVDDFFRTAFKRNDTYPANLTSYILAYGASPVSGIALTVLAAAADNRAKEAWVDLVAVTEGTLAAVMVTQVLEPLTLRTRPYVLAIADPEEREAEIAKTGAFHSFPAGHVTMAFGVAAASGVVASQRGYRLAPLVWATGLLLGAATMYTRMAADRHYFTDTLAGAAIGVLVGGGVPLIFHRPVTAGEEAAMRNASFNKVPRLMVTPVAGGQMINAGWTF